MPGITRRPSLYCGRIDNWKRKKLEAGILSSRSYGRAYSLKELRRVFSMG